MLLNSSGNWQQAEGQSLGAPYWRLVASIRIALPPSGPNMSLAVRNLACSTLSTSVEVAGPKGQRVSWGVLAWKLGGMRSEA